MVTPKDRSPAGAENENRGTGESTSEPASLALALVLAPERGSWAFLVPDHAPPTSKLSRAGFDGGQVWWFLYFYLDIDAGVAGP